MGGGMGGAGRRGGRVGFELRAGRGWPELSFS